LLSAQRKQSVEQQLITVYCAVSLVVPLHLLQQEIITCTRTRQRRYSSKPLHDEGFAVSTEVQALGLAGKEFVMFSTDWCGYCKRLKSQLAENGITFREINVEQELNYASFVEKVNGGNRVVPTLLFSDGQALTNPSVIAVKEKLASL
jgi:mycoredoxin